MPLHKRPKASREAAPTILIVDDDLDVLLLLAPILKELIPHANIRAAESALKALEIASQETIDLIITDHHMPDMTGEKLLEVLSRFPSQPASIMMTAYPSEGLAFRAANDYDVHIIIAKPFDATIMAEKAMELLASRVMNIKPQRPTRTQNP